MFSFSFPFDVFKFEEVEMGWVLVVLLHEYTEYKHHDTVYFAMDCLIMKH